MYWTDSKSRGLMQLTTKLHKRVEHQADYFVTSFRVVGSMKAKIQRWNKGISEKQAKQGEKDISEASSPQFWPISARYWT